MLISALGLSVDSFVMCLAMGPLIRSRGSRYWLAAMFGASDALAGLVGATSGIALPGRATALLAPLIALYCLFVLLLCHVPWSGRTIFLIPMLLGLDNAAAGLALPAVPVVGLVSGLIALIGLQVGATVALRFRIPRERLAGAAIIIASGVILFT